MYYNKFRENLILQLNENLVFHFNQEQFYKVKRKKWRKSRLSSMKCILEITLQKINKNYKSQFLSHNIKNISIFKLLLQVPGILFMFRRQMLNKDLCQFRIYYCHFVQQMACLLVGQYQQTGPMVPNKFLHFSVHL